MLIAVPLVTVPAELKVEVPPLLPPTTENVLLVPTVTVEAVAKSTAALTLAAPLLMLHPPVAEDWLFCTLTVPWLTVVTPE